MFSLPLEQTGDDASLVLVSAMIAAIVAAAYALSIQPATQTKLIQQASAPPRTRTNHIPPGRLPLLGDLISVLKSGDALLGWMLTQTLHFGGEPWHLHVPSQPEIIMFSSPEAFEDITITQLLMELVSDMFGAGLVTSDGERWYHQRKAAIKFFSAKVLRTLMQKTMRKNMKKLFAVLDENCPGTSAAGQTPVNLTKLFMEFTIETFAELGVGVSMDCIGASQPHPFEQGLEIAGPIIGRRFRVPGWYWKMERWLCIGHEKTLQKQMEIVKKWLHEKIQLSLEASMAKKHQISSMGSKDHKPLVEIKSVIELFVEYDLNHGDGLHADDLVDFMLTFVIGSRDTTALTLAWMLLALPHSASYERSFLSTFSSPTKDQVKMNLSRRITHGHWFTWTQRSEKRFGCNLQPPSLYARPRKTPWSVEKHL